MYEILLLFVIPVLKMIGHSSPVLIFLSLLLLPAHLLTTRSEQIQTHRLQISHFGRFLFHFLPHLLTAHHEGKPSMKLPISTSCPSLSHKWSRRLSIYARLPTHCFTNLLLPACFLLLAQFTPLILTQQSTCLPTSLSVSHLSHHRASSVSDNTEWATPANYELRCYPKIKYPAAKIYFAWTRLSNQWLDKSRKRICLVHWDHKSLSLNLIAENMALLLSISRIFQLRSEGLFK